jgi:heptosyltransferase-1
VLDLQGLARSALVSRVARAGVRLARAGQREGAHLVSRGVELPEGPIHAVEEYLTVARFAGAAPGPPRFDVPVHQDAVRRVDDRLTREGLDPTARFVVVAPSASAQWKGWPLSRWSPVVDALTTISRVVLIGTADQRAGHADLLRGSRRLAIDLTGETSLGDLVALLRRATLLVAHDSGSVHIAAALGTSVVAVYGPTNPDRLAPYGQADHVLSHRELCGPTCPAYCFRGRRCLDAISPEDVIARARLALSRHSGGS